MRARKENGYGGLRHQSWQTVLPSKSLITLTSEADDAFKSYEANLQVKTDITDIEYGLTFVEN